MRSFQCIATSLVAAYVAATASAQLESKTALHYGFGTQNQSNLLACFSLKVQVTEVNTVAKYVTALQTGTYDLVILEISNPTWYIKAAEKPVLIDLFELHLAKGGALLVNYPDLDSWPELAELCGAVVTKDRGQNQAQIFPPEPQYPAWGGGNAVPIATVWPDHGEEILPTSGYVISSWGDSSQPACVIHTDTKRIVNAFDWDQFDSGNALLRAKAQVTHLIGCRADLNFDGQLTVDDFFQFQNLFFQKLPHANMCFDEFYDVFDFLEFITYYAKGCD